MKSQFINPFQLNGTNFNGKKSVRNEYFNYNESKNMYNGPYTSERKSEKIHFRSGSLQKDLANIEKLHSNKFDTPRTDKKRYTTNTMQFDFREMKSFKDFPGTSRKDFKSGHRNGITLFYFILSKSPNFKKKKASKIRRN